MKKYIYLFLAILSMVGMLTMSSCNGNEKTSESINDESMNVDSAENVMQEVMANEQEYEDTIINEDEENEDRLMLNGHEYVDLGLSVKWATCNVGANTPEEYGDFFAWGETTPKENYNLHTYKHCNGSANTFTKYCSNAENGYNGYTDNLTTLEASDDAATVNWGAGWRMPTREEMQEMIDNCDTTWTTKNGINGMLFTSRSNGNSIFLPAAGYYFDTIHYEADGTYAEYRSSSLIVKTGAVKTLRAFPHYYEMYCNSRSQGSSVRAVCAQ